MSCRAAPLPPSVVGQIDGILSSCNNVDPGKREKFEILRHALTVDMPQRSLEAMERDPAYRTSFNLMRNLFRELTPKDTRRVCADLVK